MEKQHVEETSEQRRPIPKRFGSSIRLPTAAEPLHFLELMHPPGELTPLEGGSGQLTEPIGDSLFPPPNGDERKYCLSHFNPVTQDALDRTTANWAAFLVELVDNVASAKAGEHNVGGNHH